MAELIVTKASPIKVIPTLDDIEIERFLSKIQIGTVAECWPWLGCKFSDGYGRVAIRKQHYRVPRVAFVLHYGCDPTEFCLHHCDNPPCCNPHHLFDGDQALNMADRNAKGRFFSGPRDQEYILLMPKLESFQYRSELSPRAKLDEVSVLKIRELHAAGLTQAQLSSMFNVERQTISKIVRRTRWQHI